MPLRKAQEPLQKVTLFLFERDVDRLKSIYTTKYTTYIRLLIRAHLMKRDADLAAKGEALFEEIELEEIEPIDIGD